VVSGRGSFIFRHCQYRIYLNKRRGTYLIFRVSSVVLIQGWRLFKGGAYLISLLQQLEGWERGRLVLSYRQSLQPSRKNWRTRRFWRENWMKERRDILTLNWKTSLLMKVNSHCWLRNELQRVQCIFIILWKYSNKHRTAAAALIWGRRFLTFRPHVRCLIEGGAYLGAALIRVNMVTLCLHLH